MITMGEAQEEELPPGWYHRLQAAIDTRMHALLAHAHHLFFTPHSCVFIHVPQREKSNEMMERRDEVFGGTSLVLIRACILTGARNTTRHRTRISMSTTHSRKFLWNTRG